ncbi:cytochrome b/b6 domain-containing protein [Azohydromonas lata]|uniref:Cytochrome b/b6 domain-containing protein n=1 Tax=Azohydromonas lata TaxID=45677 RepID=A0ABU5ICH2_9BURK|nr:cytochrome b/b6 domain-containing protein [Azohydromonas lata]MDZ5456791.1 cytochrome b/b6 domain-containing protein [Azohydromonas lata]
MAHTDSLAAAGVTARPAPPGRRVTDAPTRMFHWLFALSFALGWLTAESEHWRALHVTLGYTMAGLLGFRLAYGLVGPRHARLSLLWRRVAGAPAWLRDVLRGGTGARVNWGQGQNLLLAGALAAMLLLVVPLTLSGHATYSDWGGEWLEDLHELFANAFLALVMGHLALLAVLSLVRRRNQALPMLTGRVAGSGPDLVRKDRRWLAALLLLAVLAFGAWQWQALPNGLLPSASVFSGQSHDGGD